MAQDRDEAEKFFVAGFVAGEGCFYYHDPKRWAQFCIDLHVRDIDTLYRIQSVLGCGTVRVYKSKPHMARYQVGGIVQLKERIVPFMDKYLIGTHKRDQYETWKRRITERPCRVYPKKKSFPPHLDLFIWLYRLHAPRAF